MSITPWRRFQHARLYVRGPDGEQLGYLDESTGVIHPAHARHRADLERLLEHHRRVAIAAPPQPPPPQAPMTVAQRQRKQHWQAGVARAARERNTLSEAALWAELERSSPFLWEREAVMGDYRPDFLCAAAKVDVEVDGSSHRGRETADAERDAWFAGQGVMTLRYTADQVERDAGAVAADINRWCLLRAGRPQLEAPVARLAQPAPRSRWQRLGDRLRGWTPLPSPTPESRDYAGRRLGGRFTCAGCRKDLPPTARDRRAAGRCTTCA